MNVICRTAGIASVIMLAAVASGQITYSQPHIGGPDVLSCSPAPCVLPPIQATQGGFDAPIAADPANPQNLIVGSDYTGCPYPTNSAFNLTFDGGSNWSDLFCMASLFQDGGEYGAEGSPILGYDLSGTIYVGGYYVNEDGETPTAFEAFQKSSDGRTWSTPAPVVFHQNYFPDYCWMAVDANSTSPYAGSVYVSCVMIGPTGKNFVNQVVVSHSSNGGANWTQIAVGSPQNSLAFDSGTAMTVGRDGSVYLTWMYCTDKVQLCDNNKAYMLFSMSSDGGNTWTPPSLAAAVTIHDLANSKFGVPDYPAIAVDASNGPHSGNLYISMYNWNGTSMQVQVARSTDGGKTWSKPVPVSPGVTHDQFLPWISVSPTGLVGVSWLDRRNDPKNTDYQAYAGISSDGGLTYQNVQLTTAFSNPNKGTQTQGIGDYTGNTWNGPNYFVAAWLDNSQSVYDEDFVGGIRLK